MRYIVLLFFLAVNSISAQHTFNVVREQIQVPMRDGVKLGAIVYRPDQNERFPAIVYRTPYGAQNYDGYAEFPLKAAKHGYVVFLVDVRGRYSSEGEFVAYKNEKQDGYDVIEWAARYEFCNGKVGTYGGSYPGIVQWQALSQAPPSLKAAAPEMTPIGSHHFFYYGGAFSFPWLDWFTTLIIPDKRQRANDTSGTWSDDVAEEEWQKGKQKWYGYRPLMELPLLKKYAPEYYEWLAHPDSSAWWSFVEIQNDFKKIQAPVFLLSGWYDAAYGPEGAIRAYNKIMKESEAKAAREHTKLILGPWNHTTVTTRKTRFGEIDFGPSAGFDYNQALLEWYDITLKDKHSGDALAPVNIFVMGENKWRHEQQWPLPGVKPVAFYLHSQGNAGADKSDGRLSLSVPGKEKSDAYVFDPANPLWDKSYEKSYPYDQREIESRKDVLVYTSDPLTEDLEVVGEVIAELFVSSSARDTDFSITLCDVYPDGRSINLSGLDAGYLRMRYRNGFDKQELMEPGKVYPIRIGSLYTANVFKKGHRIRLQITSSKAPHYDPNPGTGTEIASEKNLQPAQQKIFHEMNFSSRLVLPVVSK
ncbi:MAG: CocE/NonD family hydrolase [Flammeovirgaceae bacterium]|nr:MAG: CocE/NonD family hydrolase [Flammeovirgaceae bacterium]